VGDVDGQAHIGEMEAVAQANEGQTDDVVANQLLDVLSRLLHAQKQHDGLLGPVGRLEEVVELEDGVVGLVREVLVHGARVEVPHGGAAHDVHARGAQEAKVERRVHLLHEAGLLAARSQPSPAGQGP